MKITGTILIVLGLLLLGINLTAIIFGEDSPKPQFENTVHKVAFYIGYNLFNIVGVIFLAIGILLRRKSKNKRTKKELLSSLPGDPVK